MSWPQWPGGGAHQPGVGVPQPGVVQSPLINPAPNVVNPAAPLVPNSQYTPEQWAQMQQQNWQQWAQWQQQFQQWQQQYGAEYQKSMSALAQSRTSPVQPPPASFFNNAPPPLPTETKPPPPPDEPHQPNSVPFSTFSSAPPPIQCNFNTAPPPPQSTSSKEQFQNKYNSMKSVAPPHQGNFSTNTRNEGFSSDNQRFGGNQNINRGPNRSTSWQNQSKRNLPGFNDNQFGQPINDMQNRNEFGIKRPYNQGNDATDVKRNKTEEKSENHKWKSNQQKQTWSEMPLNQVENQQWDSKNPEATAKSNPEELTEAEKKFDKQFSEWESQFQKWKEQNANHPDKEQYREYEKKWEAWRSQLLDRREQMRRKRLGLVSESPQPLTDKCNKLQRSDSTEQNISDHVQGGDQSNDNFPSLRTNEKLTQGKAGSSQIGSQTLPGNISKSGSVSQNSQTVNVTIQSPKDGKPSLLGSPPSSGVKLVHTNQQQINRQVAVSSDANIGSSGFCRPPPNLNNQPLEFKKSNAEFGGHFNSSDLEDSASSFLKSTEGIPGLDLVKDTSDEDKSEDAEDKQSENPHSDLEAIARGINSILGDQKLMNMLSLVSQNQSRPIASSVTNTVSSIRVESPKFSPEQEDYDDFSNQENFDIFENKNQSTFLNSEQTRSSFKTGNEMEDIDEFNTENEHFGQRFIARSNTDFHQASDRFNQSSNLDSVSGSRNRDTDNFNRGLDSFNRGPESFSRDMANHGRNNDNFNRDVDIRKRGPDNYNIGIEDYNNGPENFNRNSNDYIRSHDYFNRNSDNFNRNMDDGCNSDNFNRGCDNFSGRVPHNNFGGIDNTRRGNENFNRFGDNFNNDPDNFDREQDDFNRGVDSFNNFSRNSDNFNTNSNNFSGNMDRFARDSENFSRNSDNFNRGPNNNTGKDGFNRGPNWGSDADNFQRNSKPDNRVPNMNRESVDNLQGYNRRNSNNNFGSEFNRSNRGTDDFVCGSRMSNTFNENEKQENEFMRGSDGEAPIRFEPPPPIDWNKNCSFPNDPVPPCSSDIPEVKNDELRADEAMWKPSSVIDYEHKTLKPSEPDVIVESFHAFDYRHKPLNRIPYPQRPKWLTDMVKNYPEFDSVIPRPFEPQQLRRYPINERFDNYQKFDDRDRKLYDDRERKSYDERDKKSYDEHEKRRNYDVRDRKLFDDRDRKVHDDSYRKSFDNKLPDDRKRDFNDDRRFGDDQKVFTNKKPYNRDSENRRYDDEYENKESGTISREKRPNRDHQSKDEDNNQFVTDKNLNPKTVSGGNLSTKSSNITLIEDLLSPPGRYNRPPRLVIILRGPPGSGKSFLAKLIKDKEVESGGSAPRILCLDDYFMVEQEKEIEEDGRKVKVKEMVYEYEECMESSYRQSLMKAFKKTITDGYFSFIIVDNINDKVKYFGEMWSFAKQNGFQVYICQMELDVQTCTKRNIHGRSEIEIEKCVSGWEQTPSHHPMLDATSLIQSGSIPEVEMEEINSPASENTNEEEHLITSKWDNFDYSVHNLAKLDGTNKPLRPSRTMEDYLQLDDEWIEPVSTKPGQKRVRWADLEERKKQEKMRAIGFVVGQTNWDRMMDPTMGSGALTQTKYIESYNKY